ncbi:MAG: hypothetical protein ACM3NS_01955 [Deltaproteobacteria bacterium]
MCVEVGDYDVSLEARKIYEVWPDPDAESLGQLRVVDESGEDYLFPAEYFRVVTLPADVDRLIQASMRKSTRRRRTASRSRG